MLANQPSYGFIFGDEQRQNINAEDASCGEAGASSNPLTSNLSTLNKDSFVFSGSSSRLAFFFDGDLSMAAGTLASDPSCFLDFVFCDPGGFATRCDPGGFATR
eukprot:m.266010 g.266010  ORF g.266010 m.266010 type:complete len:104 (+) comp64909_c0_seq1:406-717(+)